MTPSCPSSPAVGWASSTTGSPFPASCRPSRTSSPTTPPTVRSWRGAGAPTKVMAMNSSNEYWRGDAALVHGDEHPDVRVHLVAGTQHGIGYLPQLHELPALGWKGRNGFNTVDYRPGAAGPAAPARRLGRPRRRARAEHRPRRRPARHPRGRPRPVRGGRVRHAPVGVLRAAGRSGPGRGRGRQRDRRHPPARRRCAGWRAHRLEPAPSGHGLPHRRAVPGGIDLVVRRGPAARRAPRPRPRR